MEAINARNLWGVVAAGEKEAPKWHVLGIARSGVERFIMMAFEGQPVAILKVGDSLPDGVRIVKIEEDRFFVMTADKQKLAYGVYKDESAK